MKKLLLSSVIMFGVCSFVSAQSAKETKRPVSPAPTNVAPTPQKSASAAAAVASPTSDVPAAAKSADQQAAGTTPAAAVTTKPARIAKTSTEAALISADGTVAKPAAAKPVEKNKN